GKSGKTRCDQKGYSKEEIGSAVWCATGKSAPKGFLDSRGFTGAFATHFFCLFSLSTKRKSW
ncbi:MAG: hypothetical protein O3B73_05545, partial [bacterium]|nr:hypothetical protein [bacterium]